MEVCWQQALRRSAVAMICMVCVWMMAGSAAVYAWNPLVLQGSCAEKATPCSSTVGNAGGENACCDPANPRAGGYSSVEQCATRNACSGGRPYKWINLPVVWFWNPNGLSAGFRTRSETQYETALKAAWDAWNKPTCTSFQHRYGGRTTKGGERNDKTVVIYFPTQTEWAQFGAGNSTLAFARPNPASSDGRLDDGDVIFNPNIGWGTSPVQRSEYDFLAVAAHEIGHAIGLGHSQFSSALMYYATRGSGEEWSRLGGKLPADDETAICTTYPSLNCTQASDCGGCFTCGSEGKCVLKSITFARNLCKPCTKPDECGSLQDICVRTPDGNRCAQSCDSNGCCPDGYRCSEVGGGLRMCIPDAGRCAPIPCTSAAECGPGEQCANGTCTPPTVSITAGVCTLCPKGTCPTGTGCFDIDGEKRCLQPCVADNFCPTGYVCGLSNALGRQCVPEKGFCTCAKDDDCPPTQRCESGNCRIPGGGKYFDVCTDKKPCAPGYNCLELQNGNKACLQLCGASAPPHTGLPGTPGAPCNNGQCSQGAQCFSLGAGSNVCFPESCNNGICTSGGQCFQIPRVGSHCLCQKDGDCATGFCNTAILSQIFGGTYGACASKPDNYPCEKNFLCLDFSSNGGCTGQSQACVCRPGPGVKTRAIGDTCNAYIEDCKPEADCVASSNSPRDGVCHERCNPRISGQCKSGGNCIIQGSTSFYCGCSTQIPCPQGSECRNINAFTGQGLCVSVGVDCGNGACQADKGEDCSTCPADCACQNGQSCQAGACVNAGSCGNGVCETDKGEHCGTCSADCACPNGQSCQNNTCQPIPTNACGNGVCEADKGEHCGACPADCACPNGQSCKNNTCQPTQPTLPCPIEEQREECDVEGNNCAMVCVTPKTGCGCQHTPPSRPVLWFAIFFFLLFPRRRRHFRPALDMN